MPASVAFDRAADYYDETRGFPPGVEAQAAELFVRAGQLGPTSRVLEVGIGTGRIALPLAPQVGAVVGVDLARPMLDRLRAKQRGEPVYACLGDAQHLPFAPRTFDAAVAVHVFHLIPGWRAALDEVARALRPGGMLLSGWNDSPDEDKSQDGAPSMWGVWDAAVGAVLPSNVGVPREQYRTFLAEAGWRRVGEPQACLFDRGITPRQFISQIERRVWSTAWRMSDEDVARGLAAVRAFVERAGLALDQWIERNGRFVVQAYLPPE